VIDIIKFFLILSVLLVFTIPSETAFSGSGYERGEEWSVQKQFLEPHSIVFDSNDNFYVSDSGGSTSNESIFKFSIDGKFSKSLIAEKPYAMTIDSSDNLYVVNLIDSEFVIDKMTLDGEILSRYDKSNVYTIDEETSLGIDSNNNLIIKSGSNLQKINPNGKSIGKWDLSDISGIEKVDSGNFAVDSEENMYFIGQGEDKITKIDSELNYLFEWTVNKPAGMIVASDGTLFVNYGAPGSSVALFSKQGELRGELGNFADVIFRDFVGIALDSNENIYVVDKENKTITKFPRSTAEINQNQENKEITSEEVTNSQIDPSSLELETGSSDESTKIPDWIRNTMQWYIDGSISEEEMISALQYLIKEEIIKLD